MSRGTPGRFIRSCRPGSGLALGIVLMLLGVLFLDSTAPLGLRAIMGLLLLLGATIFIAALVCLLSPSTFDTEVLVTDHEITVQRPFRRIARIQTSRIWKIIAIQTADGAMSDDVTLELFFPGGSVRLSQDESLETGLWTSLRELPGFLEEELLRAQQSDPNWFLAIFRPPKFTVLNRSHEETHRE